jgi:hypothetical protein
MGRIAELNFLLKRKLLLLGIIALLDVLALARPPGEYSAPPSEEPLRCGFWLLQPTTAVNSRFGSLAGVEDVAGTHPWSRRCG